MNVQSTNSTISVLTPKIAADSSNTENTFKLIADTAGMVHEEQLQHGLVAKLLSDKSDKSAQLYHQIFGQAAASGQSTEDSVKTALKEVVRSGLITESEATTINAKSFRSAQLDGNLDMLYDNRGSTNDPTIAVKPLSEATQIALKTLEQIESGAISITARPLDAASNSVTSITASTGTNSSSSTSTNTNGFLWKPVSENDGKLVVLLPSSMRGTVTDASIYNGKPEEGGTRLESGRFSGDVHNGGRPHFRFSKPGDAYADGVYLVATLRDGTQLPFEINETGQRNST